MTKSAFEKGLIFFAASFPRSKPDKETCLAWFELLKDLTDIQFLSAIKTLCKSQKELYPGTNFIAHIRELAFASDKTYLVACFCGEVFNLGHHTERECTRCGRKYIRGQERIKEIASPSIDLGDCADKLSFPGE